jgi:hypothetical protein
MMPGDSFSTRTRRLYLLFALCLLASVRILAATPSPTTTALAVSPDGNVAAGTLLNLKATVSSAGMAVSPGLVSFCNADAAFCEDLNILGQAQLKADGSASLNLILPPGVHNVLAKFAGTRLYATSSSSSQSVAIGRGFATSTAISAVQSASQFTLTSTVTSFSPAAPTGTVIFRDTANNNAPLAQGTLSPYPAFNYAWVPNSTTSQYLTSSAVADVNGDGNLDQIGIDRASNREAILLGKGDGTFAAGPPINTGKAPYAIAVGDFNNDDIPDFAVTNSGDGTVSIFLGVGDGTFTTTAAIPVGANTTNISVGDFNNDGNADLAVSSSLGVTILLGNGTGGFAPVSTSLAVPNATTLRVADFNGDGNEDLVFTNSNSVYLFLGKGDGTFTQSTSLSISCTAGCVDVLAADLNGDGKPDLAVADPGPPPDGAGSLVILLGKGDGTFGTQVANGYEKPQSLALGDFNGDGKPDIASNDGGYTPLAIIWLNNGQGSFPNLDFISGPTFFSTVGDFNHEGATGLVLGVSGPVVEPQWQTTATGSGQAISGSLGIHNVFANYEGDRDHLASSSGTVALQGPQAATTLALDVTPLPVSPGRAVTLVATVSPSAVEGYHPGGTVAFWNGPHLLGTRTVAFATGQAIYTTNNPPVSKNGEYLTAFYSGDTRFTSSTSAPVRLTGAGALRPASTTSLQVSPASEVVPGTVVTLSASVWNGGTRVTPGLVLFYDRLSSNSRETVLGQAQLTQSGTATLKLRLGVGLHSLRAAFQGTNAVAGSSSIIQDLTVAGTPLADGVGTSYSLTAVPPPYVHTPQEAAAVADFNNDGILDVAMLDGGPSLHILLGNPDGTFDEKAPIQLPGDSWLLSLVVADFNSDGKPDLAVLQASQDGSTQNLIILLGEGGGFFRTEVSMTVAPQISMVEGDFNGDGIPDLATTNQDGSVSILLGTGYGRFQPTKSIASGAALYNSVFVADFNGDGILDIATTVKNSSTPTSLLLGNGDGTFVSASVAGSAGCGSLVAVADFNGDGYQDLAIECTGGLKVLLGSGSATFKSPILAGGGFAPTVVADMNNDGIPDLVQTYTPESYVGVLLGRGDGTFVGSASVTVPYSGFAAQSVVGDFNGDGIPDVITAVENGYPWMQTGPVETMGEWFGTIVPDSQ